MVVHPFIHSYLQLHTFLLFFVFRRVPPIVAISLVVLLLTGTSTTPPPNTSQVKSLTQELRHQINFQKNGRLSGFTIRRCTYGENNRSITCQHLPTYIWSTTTFLPIPTIQFTNNEPASIITKKQKPLSDDKQYCHVARLLLLPPREDEHYESVDSTTTTLPTLATTGPFDLWME